MPLRFLFSHLQKSVPRLRRKHTVIVRDRVAIGLERGVRSVLLNVLEKLCFPLRRQNCKISISRTCAINLICFRWSKCHNPRPSVGPTSHPMIPHPSTNAAFIKNGSKPRIVCEGSISPLPKYSNPPYTPNIDMGKDVTSPVSRL